MKNRKLKTKNIIIIYNIITILKYLFINKDISIFDFKIDFILLNLSLFIFLECINLLVIDEKRLIKKISK